MTTLLPTGNTADRFAAIPDRQLVSAVRSAFPAATATTAGMTVRQAARHLRAVLAHALALYDAFVAELPPEVFHTTTGEKDGNAPTT